MARAIKAMKVKFDLVLTSPYVRAKQTEDIVVEEFGVHQKLCLCGALTPGSKARDLVEESKRHSRSSPTVMRVGHEPGMSMFASLLVSGKPDADLTLKRVGLCVVDTGDLAAGQRASLGWLLAPRLLLRLANWEGRGQRRSGGGLATSHPNLTRRMGGSGVS